MTLNDFIGETAGGLKIFLKALKKQFFNKL